MKLEAEWDFLREKDCKFGRAIRFTNKLFL